MMPIRVRGKRYPSKKAAAIDLGMCLSTLYVRLKRGRSLATPLDVRRDPTPKKVRVGRYVFPSQMAAAKALGMNFTTLSERLQRGIPLTSPVRITRPRTKT